MDDIKIPEFLNTQEKYNKVIHEIDSIKKFEDIVLKLLDDESLDMTDVVKLMKILERDVILVNKLDEIKHLLDITESFMRYICVKEGKPLNISEQKPEKQEEKEPKPLKKITKLGARKQKNKVKAYEKPEKVMAGKWECDC